MPLRDSRLLMDVFYESTVFKAVVEHSVDAVIIINRSGEIVFWNHSAEKMFGYESHEVLGKYIHDIVPTHDVRSKANESFQKFKEKGTGPLVGKVLQVRGLKKDGTEFHTQFSFNKIEINGHLYAFAFLRDITELITLQENLRDQATHDELTGLHNRRSFFNNAKITFKSAQRHCEAYSLIMIDIDLFKSINDKFGHRAGDQALKTFSKAVSQIVRDEDIFARIGGEEFVIALPKTEKEAAYQLAERVRTGAEGLMIESAGNQFHITISAGVAALDQHKKTFEQLYQCADEALYQAKDAGRNCLILL